MVGTKEARLSESANSGEPVSATGKTTDGESASIVGKAAGAESSPATPEASSFSLLQCAMRVSFQSYPLKWPSLTLFAVTPGAAAESGELVEDLMVPGAIR